MSIYFSCFEKVFTWQWKGSMHLSKPLTYFTPKKIEKKNEKETAKRKLIKKRRKKAIMRPAHVGRAWAICPLYGAISVCPFGVATCPSAFKKSCGAKSGLISYHWPRPQERVRVSSAATVYHECVRQMAAGVDKGDLQHCGPADIILETMATVLVWKLRRLYYKDRSPGLRRNIVRYLSSAKET